LVVRLRSRTPRPSGSWSVARFEEVVHVEEPGLLEPVRLPVPAAGDVRPHLEEAREVGGPVSVQHDALGLAEVPAGQEPHLGVVARADLGVLGVELPRPRRERLGSSRDTRTTAKSLDGMVSPCGRVCMSRTATLKPPAFPERRVDLLLVHLDLDEVRVHGGVESEARGHAPLEVAPDLRVRLAGHAEGRAFGRLAEQVGRDLEVALGRGLEAGERARAREPVDRPHTGVFFRS
jgi:hypothetical protein